MIISFKNLDTLQGFETLKIYTYLQMTNPGRSKLMRFLLCLFPGRHGGPYLPHHARMLAVSMTGHVGVC